MKKNLLLPFAALIVAGSLNAQQSITNAPQLPKHLANKTMKTMKHRHALLNANSSASLAPNNDQRAISTINVGLSTYQLQSNSSVQNRIVFSGGTVSATWTWSNTGTWADRGTGYVFHDGTSFSPAPTARIEGVRTGWPSMMVLGNGGEAVITHNTAGSNLMLTNRPAKGTGAWTDNATIIASAAPYGNFWPRATTGGTDGNSIHLISISNPVDPSSNPVYFNGQQGCLTYSRSQDGGATFDILHNVPTQHNSSNYVGFSADSYAIDARGTTVAYVVGGEMNDLFLMKSTDNGSTWTKTNIMNFPIPMFVDQLTDVDGDGNIDTITTNDGTVALLIDQNDDVHVWFGNMRVINDDSTDAQYSFFPGTLGLMYWNENMGTSAPVMIGSAEDIDGSTTLDVTDWGSYYNSLSSFPSAGIDGNNTIHLTFSSIIEFTDFGNGKSFRNIYHMSTSDGGMTWTPQVRINPDDFNDQVWCSVARNAEPTCVRMIYQSDYAPGHGVQSTNPDYADNGGVVADEYYACLDPTTGVADVINVEEMVSVYPNPANNQFNIATINPMQTVEIYNSMGNLVASLGNINATKVSYDANNLASGIYLINITSGNQKITKQLIKE